MAKRVRDYRAEYARRQNLAKSRGSRSYGAERYSKEAPKRPGKVQGPITAKQAKSRAKYQENKEKQNAVASHIETVLSVVKTNKPVDPKVVMRGVRKMTKAERLQALASGGDDIRSFASEPDSKYWYHT